MLAAGLGNAQIGQLNVVRVWGTLRVMTPDGYPIYQESKSCPGAAAPDELNAFRAERFPAIASPTQALDHHHAH